MMEYKDFLFYIYATCGTLIIMGITVVILKLIWDSFFKKD